MELVSAVMQAWRQPGAFFIECDPAASAAFWGRLRQKYPHRVLSLPHAAHDYAAWQGQLQQSFLGESIFFWCTLEAGAKASKTLQRSIDFLKAYQGPHAVVVHGNADQALSWGTARRSAVKEHIALGSLADMAALLGFERSAKILEAMPAFVPKTVVTLDEALHFLLHAGYVPVRSPEASASFLERLLPHDVSLNALSELLLKRDWPAFFLAWPRMQPLYSEVFWISFFAEQLWRAYWVCSYLRRGQQTKARSIGYRLPATFMQQGWRQVKPEALFAAYECVAFFDSRFKRGAVSGVHELVTALVGLL